MAINQSRRAELVHLYGIETLAEFRRRYGMSRYLQWWAARVGARTVGLEVEKFLTINCTRLKPAPESTSHYDIRPVSVSDAYQFVGRDYDLSEDFLKGLSPNADICMGAFEDDRLAAYGWFTRSPRDLKLPPNMAYTYKAFTRPEHRGLGLQSAIKQNAWQLLQADGVEQFLTIVNWINWPSQRACHWAGYKTLGQTTTFRIGRREFVVASPSISRSGIRFGHNHEVHQSPGRVDAVRF